MFNDLLYYRECADFWKKGEAARVCIGQQSVRAECAVDGGRTCGDVTKIKARFLSEPSLVLQIPPWSHCMHTGGECACTGLPARFLTQHHVFTSQGAPPFHHSASAFVITASVRSIPAVTHSDLLASRSHLWVNGILYAASRVKSDRSRNQVGEGTPVRPSTCNQRRRILLPS